MSPKRTADSRISLYPVLDQGDPFWEACARHTIRQTSRTVQSVYLCDLCAIRLMTEALNQRPPIYHGESISGFCGLCNNLLLVRLRLWFACPVCWNVILSYQKGFAASLAVQQYWIDRVKDAHSDLTLTESDQIQLMPYVRGKQTKKIAAEQLTSLDFLVTGDREPLFHIELKAGPGSVDAMSDFQLDINDSNDIIGVVNNTQLPAYIFHVQLESLYLPPTRSTRATNMWWTDLPTLLRHRRKVGKRRGEDKEAGYYDPRCFKPIETFTEELDTKRYHALRDSIRQHPPLMY